MINNFEDKQKAVNILFQETIDNMDNYYTNDKNQPFFSNIWTKNKK